MFYFKLFKIKLQLLKYYKYYAIVLIIILIQNMFYIILDNSI